MPLLNQPAQVRQMIEEYGRRSQSLACFCVENTFTMEGILQGCQEFARERNLSYVPIYVAVTANYHGRQQLRNYTSLNSIEEGFLNFRADLERLCRPGGAFDRVMVIPSLDHGQPEMDEFLFEAGRGFWGCVMYDASSRPLAENIRLTREFVRRHRHDYVIEGCVDEIIESGAGGMCLTEPEQAKRFFQDCGVDLIVANLGTEHRATKAELHYESGLARQIRACIGSRIVLHGTSSLSQEDLRRLPQDGIVKVNIWTILETTAAEALQQHLIRNSAKILSGPVISQLCREGWLGPKALEQSQIDQPTLAAMAEVHRKAIKVPEVRRLVKEYLAIFRGAN